MGIKRTPEQYDTILRERGRSLRSEGLRDVALPVDAALEAIGALKAARIPVLGGEVWVEKGPRFELRAAEIWDIERAEFEDEEQFLAASWKLAEEQVARLRSTPNVLVTLTI